MSKKPHRRKALTIAISAALLSSAATANTFTVTSLADSGPGTLRDTLQQADGVAGAVVEFDPALFATPAQIELLNQISLNSADMVIAGPGLEQLTIALDGGSYGRLFDIGGSSVTIQDLTIAGSGNSLWDNGGLARITTESTTIERTHFRNGRVEGSHGGCLALLPQNLSGGDSISATIVDSTFSSCDVGSYGGSGGGLFASFESFSLPTMSLSVTNSRFISNGVGSTGGGAMAVRGATLVSIDGTEFTDNQAWGYPGYGGAVYVTSGIPSEVFITRSSLTSNLASAGGGIYADGQQLTVEVSGSTLNSNTAFSGGSALTLDEGELVVVNSTASGNGDPSAFNLGSAAGAALFTHSTLTNNVGLAIRNQTTIPTSLNHTIASGNSPSAPIDLMGPFESSFSIVGTVDNEADFTDTGGTIRADDPELNPLADNGGPTLTHMPIENGIAVEAGDPALVPTPEFDQRGAGFPRLTPPRISIGSVEPEGQDLSDLAITISPSGPASVPVGTPVTWQMSVDNLGPDDLVDPVAFGVQNLPAEIEFDSFNTPFGADCQLSTATSALCNRILSAGESAVLELSGIARQPGNVDLLAEIDCPQADLDCSNNTDSAGMLEITPVSDLALAFVNGPAEMVLGSTGTWTFQADNLGPNDISATQVEFALPANLEAVSAVATNGAACALPTGGAGGVVTCDVTSFATGSPFEVSIDAEAAALGIGTVAGEIACPAVDPDCSNNADLASTVEVISLSDLALEFVTGPAEMLIGATGTWRFRVDNLGPNDISATQVELVLPENLEATSIQVPAGVQCALPQGGVGGSAVCDVSAFPAGAPFEIALEATAASVGTSVITGEVECPAVDPDCSNNADASGPLGVTSVSDLALEFMAGPASEMLIGSTGTWAFRVSNLGPDEMEATQLQFALPANLEAVSVVASNGAACALPATSPGGSITCDVTAFSPGAAFEVSLEAAAAAVGTATIAGEVTCPEVDPDCLNNADVSSEVALISESDLSLSAQASAYEGLEPGESVDIEFIGENLGPLAYDGPWEMTIAAPPGLSITGVGMGRGGSCAAGSQAATWVCGGVNFALEHSAAVSIGAVMEEAGDWVVTASLTCPDTDPDCANNQAAVGLNGVAPPPEPQAEAVAVPTVSRLGLSLTALMMGLIGLLGIRRFS